LLGIKLRNVEYRNDIQVLRGIAVCAVILFHAKEDFFPLGFLGVDVFFVISGFVVTPLILRIIDKSQGENNSVKARLLTFFLRRVYRLGPTLSVTILVSLTLIFFLGPPEDHQKFFRQSIATLLLLGNIGAYQYSGNYFSPNPNPLIHTWSLSVEEQIYIFVPIVLIAVNLIFHSAKNVLISMYFFFTLASFFFFIQPDISDNFYSPSRFTFSSDFLFYSPLTRLWQFTLGGLLFFWTLKKDSSNDRNKMLPSLFFIFSLLLLLLSQFKIDYKMGSILVTFVTILIIKTKSLEDIPSILGSYLAWTGDRSYSLYLFHMPLIYLAKYSTLFLLPQSQSRAIQTSIAVLFTFLLSDLNYRKIEVTTKRGDFPSKKLKLLGGRNLIRVPVILFSVLLTMDFCWQRGYFGLDQDRNRTPAYAGELDSNCARDSQGGPPCSYFASPVSRKTVLLLGDSHAGHLSQAFVDSALSEGFNAVVWTQSGCDFVITNKSLIDNCFGVKLEKLEWIKSNKPDAVFFSQLIESHDMSKLKESLLSLKGLDTRLFVIGNNPIFPDWERFFVKRSLIHQFLNSEPDYAKEKLVNEMQIKYKIASLDLTNWAHSNNIDTLDIWPIFCDKVACHRFREGDWLYRDVDHFSVAGANFLKPSFIEFFRQLNLE